VMKQSRIRWFLAFGVVLALCGAVGIALFAQTQPRSHGMGLGRMGAMQGRMGPDGMGAGMMNPLIGWGRFSRRLNLTSDQRQQIRTDLQALRPLAQQMRDARQKLTDAVINGGDVAGAAKSVADLHAQLVTEGATAAQQIVQNVLTDQQRTEARQLWSQWEQRQAQRRQRQRSGDQAPRK
jgi:hypothetical protein